ncbi:hypothetical protein NDU88_000620 [Pleurodeles waltl]|uniref:Uncharacterized protein n=1 Tax=Pleurodeles waltl TaxID=8319 RepID=A0AAV7S7Q4_PLEWA|nr:hypothetical protein NDU88_000620 [Pleurodeles waltl]
MGAYTATPHWNVWEATGGGRRGGGKDRGPHGKGAVRRVSRLGAQFVDAYAHYNLSIEVEEGLMCESGQAVGPPDSLEERSWDKAAKMAKPMKINEPIVISNSEDEGISVLQHKGGRQLRKMRGAYGLI